MPETVKFEKDWIDSIIEKIVMALKGTFRACSIMAFIFWLILNGVIGVMTLAKEKGAVSTIIDIHTPPVRQVYIGISVLILLMFAITVLLYVCRCRVLIKDRQVPEKCKNVLRKVRKVILGYMTLFALAVFPLIGGLCVLGIFDMSYYTKQIWRYVFIWCAIIIIFTMIYSIFHWLLVHKIKIVKDDDMYGITDVYITPKGVKVLIIASERSLFGRVYYIRRLIPLDRTDCTRHREYIPGCIFFSDYAISRGMITARQADILFKDAKKKALSEISKKTKSKLFKDFEKDLKIDYICGV